MNVPLVAAEGPARRSTRAAEGLESRLPDLLLSWRGTARSANSPESLTVDEYSRAGAALFALQRGLTGDRRLAGRGDATGYMDSADLLGAYLLYYWPVSYLEVFLSLSFARLRAPRVLDLGSGPGPATAAFFDAAGAAEAFLVDGSDRALELAAELLPPGARTEFLKADLEREALPELGRFDAAVASHLLNELWKGRADRLDRRLDFLASLALRLAPGGFVLAVEPATLAAGRDLLSLRDGLAERGWRIVAPCPASGPCPMLAAGEGRNCHGEAPWVPPEPVAGLAARAGLDRTSVKWTFFIAVPPDGQGKRETRADRVPATGTQVSGRVVSEGLLNKAGRLRYSLCTGEGLVSLSAKADSPLAAKLGFQGLRRYDSVSLTDGERRDSGFGLAEGCDLAVEEAPTIDGRGRAAPGFERGARRAGR